MPSLRAKKATVEGDEERSVDAGTGTIAGRALALRPPRPKLALAGAGIAAATVALLAAVLARRRRD